MLELYHKLKGTELDLKGNTVFTYWKRRDSLGEIHSISMCLIRECGVFLSDDGDSKKLQNIVQDTLMVNIGVYKREELMEKMKHFEKLSRPERRAFSHS